MSELPENVDLQWIGRHLIEFRDEMRADLNVLMWSVMRIERNLAALREDVDRLWLAHGDLRRRIEALEERGS